MTESDGLNVTEAAAFLGMSRSSVYALVKSGTIPHYRLGTQPRFSRTALVIWQGGGALEGIFARVAAVIAGVAARAPTGAPTAPPTRRTPKHIGGHRRLPTPRLAAIPRSGATVDDRP